MTTDNETRLGRDELEDLLETPAVTIYSWWQQGHLNPPSNPGSHATQASFDLDDTFALAIFAKAVRKERRKLREAGVLGRYLQTRPGSAQVVHHFWDEPVSMTCFPSVHVAGFTPPYRQILRLIKEARKRRDKIKAELEKANKKKDPDLLLTYEDAVWSEIGNLILRESDPRVVKSEPSFWFDRGILASEITRWVRRLQDPNTQNQFFSTRNEPTVFFSYVEGFRGLNRFKDIDDTSLLDQLCLESLASDYAEDGLRFNGYAGPPKSKKPSSFTIEIQSIIDQLLERFAPRKQDFTKRPDRPDFFDPIKGQSI